MASLCKNPGDPCHHTHTIPCRLLANNTSTRAKKCTYVLYDAGNPSPFISEFVPDVGGDKKSGEEIPKEEICPRCGSGRRIMVKKGKASNGNPYYVYVCTNEAYGCDYREVKFVNLNGRGGFRPRRQR